MKKRVAKERHKGKRERLREYERDRASSCSSSHFTSFRLARISPPTGTLGSVKVTFGNVGATNDGTYTNTGKEGDGATVGSDREI